MLLRFEEFLLEELKLKPLGLTRYEDGGEHYSDRRRERLAKLKTVGLLKGGRQVTASPEIMKTITDFYRAALSHLASPYESSIFRDVTVGPNRVGIVRIGKPVVVLPDGSRVNPIFRVMKKVKNGVVVEEQDGTIFWIITLGDTVLTIKLYYNDGESSSQKNDLILKSIQHFKDSREGELDRIVRLNNLPNSSNDELAKVHTVVPEPSGIKEVLLDLSSDVSPEEQLSNLIKKTEWTKEEEPQVVPIAADLPQFEIENVPKQMNVTPGKTWLMEYNASHKTWGAIPIFSSVQVAGLNGKEIAITLGKKWLHWLETPNFNPLGPTVPRSKRLKKGDRISLAKELSNGEWLVNTGTITEISTDSRSEYPFVKTKGWDSSEVIPSDMARRIFRIPVEDSEKYFK